MSTAPERQTVIVNGDTEEVPVGMTLEDVLQWENLSITFSPGVAVALNDEVVPREAWKDHIVHDGDRIEVVTATQGG